MSRVFLLLSLWTFTICVVAEVDLPSTAAPIDNEEVQEAKSKQLSKEDLNQLKTCIRTIPGLKGHASDSGVRSGLAGLVDRLRMLWSCLLDANYSPVIKKIGMSKVEFNRFKNIYWNPATYKDLPKPLDNDEQILWKARHNHAKAVLMKEPDQNLKAKYVKLLNYIEKDRKYFNKRYKRRSGGAPSQGNSASNSFSQVTVANSDRNNQQGDVSAFDALSKITIVDHPSIEATTANREENQETTTLATTTSEAPGTSQEPTSETTTDAPSSENPPTTAEPTTPPTESEPVSVPPNNAGVASD